MNTFLRSLTRYGAPVALAITTPLIAFGQTTTGSCTLPAGNIGGIFTFAICVIDVLVVPLVFAIAFIVFIIGIYRYFIAGAANEEKRQEGQRFVMWGLIGFVLMFSVWGLINVLVSSLGFGGSARPSLPVFFESNRGATNQSQTSSPTLPASSNSDSGTFTDTPPY